MVVYHHFEGRAEVLQAAADQVWMEAMLSVEAHDGPVEDIIHSFVTVRRVFMGHADISTHASSSGSAASATSWPASYRDDPTRPPAPGGHQRRWRERGRRLVPSDRGADPEKDTTVAVAADPIEGSSGRARPGGGPR